MSKPVVVSSTIESVQVFRRGATVVRRAVLEGAVLDDGVPPLIELAGLPMSLTDPTVRVAVLDVLPTTARVMATGVQVGIHVRPGLPPETAPAQRDIDEVAKHIGELDELMRLIDNELGLLTGIPVPDRPNAEEGRAPPPAPLAMRLALETFVDDAAEGRRLERRRLQHQVRELSLQHAALVERVRAASTAAEVKRSAGGAARPSLENAPCSTYPPQPGRYADRGGHGDAVFDVLALLQARGVRTTEEIGWRSERERAAVSCVDRPRRTERLRGRGGPPGRGRRQVRRTRRRARGKDRGRRPSLELIAAGSCQVTCANVGRLACSFRASRTQTSRTQTSRTQTSRTQTSRTQTSRTQTSRTQTSRTQTSRTQTSRTQTSRTQTSRTQTSRNRALVQARRRRPRRRRQPLRGAGHRRPRSVGRRRGTVGRCVGPTTAGTAHTHREAATCAS
jgi:hypothetical protein